MTRGICFIFSSHKWFDDVARLEGRQLPKIKLKKTCMRSFWNQPTALLWWRGAQADSRDGAVPVKFTSPGQEVRM